MEITIHTGCQGDSNKINIDWHDHNNVHRKEILEVNVLEKDKPRTLVFKINGLVLATKEAVGES